MKLSLRSCIPILVLNASLDCLAQSSDSFKWAEIPVAAQKATVSQLVLGSPIDPTAPEAASTYQFLNTWMNSIDSKVRANSTLYDFTLIPKPHILLVKSRNADALASTGPACYKVSIRFKNKKPTKVALAAMLQGDQTVASKMDPRNVDQGGSIFLTDTVAPDQCAQKTLTADQLPSFVQFLKTYTQCSAVVFHDGKESGIQLNNCPVAATSKLPQPQKYDGATTLIINAESNWITVTTALLIGLEKQEALVAVLSHELSHFYSAHLLAEKNKYGYFYSETADRKSVPTADVKLNTQTWPFEMDTLLQVLYSAPVSTALAGDALFFKPLVTAFQDLLDKSDSKDCAELKVVLANQVSAKSLSVPLLKSCLGGIELTQDMIAGKGKITAGDIQMAVTNKIHNFMFPVSKLDNMKTAFEVFSFLNKIFLDNESKVTTLLTQELTEKLGHYTIEQDADEKSLGIMEGLGISPYEAIDMILRLGTNRQKEIGKPYPLVASAEDCIQYYNRVDKSWLSSSLGLIHLGTLTDPHHQYCYRAKNIFDRSQANGYAKDSRLNLQPTLWSQFQQAVQALTGAVKHP